MSGANLDLLRTFLNLLTARMAPGADDPAEFQIDDSYSVPGVGTVVSGTDPSCFFFCFAFVFVFCEDHEKMGRVFRSSQLATSEITNAHVRVCRVVSA